MASVTVWSHFSKYRPTKLSSLTKQLCFQVFLFSKTPKQLTEKIIKYLNFNCNRGMIFFQQLVGLNLSCMF